MPQSPSSRITFKGLNFGTRESVPASMMSNPAIDLVFLSRQTGDNDHLSQQLLELFLKQSPVYLTQMQEADSPESWYRHCHGFKGSSREIGAFALADLIEKYERGGDRFSENKDVYLKEIEGALYAAQRFIQNLKRTTH